MLLFTRRQHAFDVDRCQRRNQGTMRALICDRAQLTRTHLTGNHSRKKTERSVSQQDEKEARYNRHRAILAKFPGLFYQPVMYLGNLVSEVFFSTIPASCMEGQC